MNNTETLRKLLSQRTGKSPETSPQMLPSQDLSQLTPEQLEQAKKILGINTSAEETRRQEEEARRLAFIEQEQLQNNGAYRRQNLMFLKEIATQLYNTNLLLAEIANNFAVVQAPEAEQEQEKETEEVEEKPIQKKDKKVTQKPKVDADYEDEDDSEEDEEDEEDKDGEQPDSFPSF